MACPASDINLFAFFVKVNNLRNIGIGIGHFSNLNLHRVESLLVVNEHDAN